jgi:hypothetical protein
MADRTRSGTFSVVITNSGSDDNVTTHFERLPANRRRNFNQLLPSPTEMRGIYIGGSGNYKLYVQETGAQDGEVTPYLQIAGGIVHPISCCRIIRDDRYTTDAPNIVVLY